MTQTLNGLTRNDALEKALEAMPQKFTSQDIGRYCRNNGFDFFPKGVPVISRFLKSHENTLLQISRNTWQKKYAAAIETRPNLFAQNHELDASKYLMGGIKSIDTYLEQMPIESLVKFIASKGYVVLKP